MARLSIQLAFLRILLSCDSVCRSTLSSSSTLFADLALVLGKGKVGFALLPPNFLDLGQLVFKGGAVMPKFLASSGLPVVGGEAA